MMSFSSDTEDKELAKILVNLLPYQVQGLYLLQDIERRKRGGIFDPHFFGGNDLLICLMMTATNSQLSTRDETLNCPKRQRKPPENTIVFSSSVENWKKDFDRYPHLRVLYLGDGSSGSKINFFSNDIVVCDCQNLNLKKLNDRRSKAIKEHGWHRLLVDGDLNKEMRDFVLNLKAENRWLIGTSNMLNGYNDAQANFMHALLKYTSATSLSVASLKEIYQRVIPKVESLYPFGSKMVETVYIQLTDEEKEIYLADEFRVKKKLEEMKRHGNSQVNLDEEQRRAEEKLTKERFQDLERCILRLREFATSITSAVNKADIRGNFDLIKKYNEIDENDICPVCRSEFQSLAIIMGTSCDHFFCHNCMEDHCLKRKECAYCRGDVDEDSVFCLPFKCNDVSSKATELLKRLTTKSIIVSKFDKLLNWFETHLTGQGFKSHRLLRNMDAEEVSDVARLFQHTTSDESVVLLADMEAISGELDLSSVQQIFFMEAVKENEENLVISHILKGKKNDMFRKACRLVARDVIEEKMVGLKGKVGVDFKELNMKEIEDILT